MLTTSITLHRKPKDGSSVTIISKSVTYQISASGTETPTGSWSDKVVLTTDTKPYLWTRTIVVYSDTNSTTSYSVSYRGKDGTSVTILSTKVLYQVSASPTDIPTTWYDDIKNAIQTDSKPYLWSKTIVVYSNNNNTTITYSVSYKGKDGTNGTSFTPKGMADGYYSKATEIPAYSDEQNGKIYIVDDATNVTSPFIVPDAPYVVQYVLHNGEYVLFLVHAEFGDGYNVNGHLYVANDDKWVDFGEIQGAKGEQGDPGIPGKDAINIVFSPAELVFDADENGNLIQAEKSAEIKVYRGTTELQYKTDWDNDAEIGDNCWAALLVNTTTNKPEVKISGITSSNIDDVKVPATSGGANVTVIVDGVKYRAYLPFSVNVNTYANFLIRDNKKYISKYTEISNKYNTVSNELNGKASKDELREVSSSIEQTARRISLEVSSNAVGRRNLLVNSDFHNQESLHFSSGTRIECTTGKDGINCVHITSSSENGVYWDGTKSGGMSVVITKGKKYTFSCWVKSSSTSAQFRIRTYSTSAIANASSKTDFYETVWMNVSSPNTWEQFRFTIDTSSAVTNYLAVIFCVTSASDAYICQPMMEEGDTYKGWSRSPQDYDYVGGNMLDNTLSLDKSGSLYDVNGTLTPAGFGESTSIYKSFAYELKGIVDSFSQLPTYGNVYNDTYYVRNDGTCYAYNGSNFENVGNDYYYNILEWRKGKSGEFSPFGLEANKDYVFSFMAKGTGKITAYLYNPDTDVFVESSLGAIYITADGSADFQLTNEWRRYWLHWRPSDSLHKYILLRLTRSFKSDGSSPITDCYIAQPKLEDGATMTEYTERKTDLVDKASLKAAGIEITSDMVELYGNQVKVSGAKGGAPVAMFENGMLNSNLINADKIMARQLQTTGSNGQSVSIENGLMRVYGTNGRCNIEFGVNSNGEAILSYYDKDGKWLYDLGPNKLDGGQLTESTLDGDKYVTAASFFGTNDFFTLETYINVTVKQVRREYSQMLFGNNLFSNDDQEIANNNAAHMGYKPFERVSASDVKKLYRYTAPRQSGTIIKDERYGLTTPALAKQADGKYFTSNSVLATNEQLTNLAPAGYYFRQSVQVMMAPYPMPSAVTQSVRFPAYSISCLNITGDSTGTVMNGFNSMMSYLMRTIKIQIQI